MKGQAKPSWTPGRHAWLSKLKARGGQRPKGTAEGSVATYCRALGWSAVHPPAGHTITTEGLAVLARWDSGDTSAPPKPKAKPVPRGFILTGLTPAQLVAKLLEMPEGVALEVRDALTLALEGAPQQARFEPGGPVASMGVRPGEVAADVSPPRQAVDDTQPVTAPQFRVRRPMVSSLGLRTTPPGFSDCLACCGRGTVGHNFLCQPCHGSGKIRREVEP